MKGLQELTNALSNSTTLTPYGLPFLEIGSSIPSAKSIAIAEIPLAAMAVGLQPYSER